MLKFIQVKDGIFEEFQNEWLDKNLENLPEILKLFSKKLKNKKKKKKINEIRTYYANLLG